LCLRAIDDCDVLYAWIDSTDAYGTYSEIGWAAARQKTVWLAGPREFTDLWFVYQLAGLALFNQADALTGFRALRSVAAGKATLADFEPATDKQRAYLLSLGAPGERVDAVTKRQAQQLIGELRARRLGKERRRGLS
jgi:hypothetical protein